MIEWSQVERLQAEVGSEEFPEIVELFMSEVELVLAPLGTVGGDNKLAEDLHFLKGSAQTLGFVAFSRICQDAEQALASGEVNTTRVRDCYERSKEAFLAEYQHCPKPETFRD